MRLRLIGLGDAAKFLAECSGRDSRFVGKSLQHRLVFRQSPGAQRQIPVKQPKGGKTLLAVQRIERVTLHAAVHKVKYQGLGIVLQGVEQLPEKTLAQKLLAFPPLGIIALDDGDDNLFIVQKFPE